MTRSPARLQMHSDSDSGPPRFVRGYQSNVFDYWLSKGALASGDDLLRCVAQVKECIEQMNFPPPGEPPIVPILNPKASPDNDIPA